MNKPIYEFEVMKGFILSNLFAFSIIGITRFLKPDPGVFIYAEFVIVPLIMGIITV